MSLEQGCDGCGNIAEHVVRCAHKIWDEKAIGLIYSHYRHNAVVHSADGMTYSRDQIIADAIKTLAAFPDMHLYGDDLIWSGDERAGFHTSHRTTWIGHNTGHSIYGPPTGRKVVYRAIANSFMQENRVVEEWIARDELALIRQLGFDEIDLARKLAARDAAGSGWSSGYGAIERVAGQTTPEQLPRRAGEGFDVEEFVRRSQHKVWNWRLLNKIDEYYASNYVAHIPTHRELYGPGDLKAFILALLAAFPDAQLSVDHVCSLGNEQDGYRSALRWTLQGTHKGPGVYGEPTGKRIRLPGISHQLIKGGRVVQEWTVFDEFALLKQLHAPGGTSLPAESARPQ